MDEIIFEEKKGVGGSLGIIILNRPNALNALNHAMLNAMSAQLAHWEKSSTIKGVIIKATPGKAFCAGGDIRATYEYCKNKNPSIKKFFYDEYLLNAQIFHYSKPYIALLNGITMGGGAGISVHGSHRIGTEKLIFAMPETGIGFFPDVGGTYFLPRLPQHLGILLGLTGHRLSVDECLYFGIIDYKLNENQLVELEDNLLQSDFGLNPKQSVANLIKEFSQPVNIAVDKLTEYKQLAECFREKNVETIIEKLKTHSNAFSKNLLQELEKKSPTSLKVTLEALIRGERLSFDECMQQEYRLVCRFLEGHDFVEGVRALLIDKDLAPVWQPKTLSEISPDLIKKYFAPLKEELFSNQALGGY